MGPDAARAARHHAGRDHFEDDFQQAHHLLPEFDALENVVLPQMIAGRSKTEAAKEAARQAIRDELAANDAKALRALFGQLAGQGVPVVVVDQPASIGALPVAVAQAMGLDTAYLPGLAMRRIADLHPGEAKTDARDGQIGRRNRTQRASTPQRASIASLVIRTSPATIARRSALSPNCARGMTS